MIKTNNPKVKYLIDPSIKKSSSDFSAGIADLGAGHMQQGINNLWKDGEYTGFAEGVVVTVVVVGICVLVQKAVHKYRIKQAVAMLNDDPKESVDAPIPTTDVDNEETPQAAEEESEITE